MPKSPIVPDPADFEALSNKMAESKPISPQEELQQLELEAKRLELAERREAAAKKLEEDTAKKNFIESRRIAVAEEMRQRAAIQAGCMHLKPNGYPSIGGQRDHHGNRIFLCLFCNAVWQNELPAHLRNFNPDLMGGPS